MSLICIVLCLICIIVALIAHLIQHASKAAVERFFGRFTDIRGVMGKLAQKTSDAAVKGLKNLKIMIGLRWTEIICLFLAVFFLAATIATFSLELMLMGGASYLGSYSRDDAAGDCHCIAECVHGAGTVDLSKTSYGEDALWANGYYLTHDPFNAAGFISYANYVQSIGAFHTPGTNVPKLLPVPTQEKWAEGTDYECTFDDYMDGHPLVVVSRGIGNYDPMDCYQCVDDLEQVHYLYINTEFYRYTHEQYARSLVDDASVIVTTGGEHDYIQAMLDANRGVNYSSLGAEAIDWVDYPEISSTYAMFFCKTYEYACEHKDDGTETDYESMVNNLSAYAKWFYNGEGDGNEGNTNIAELSQSKYYGYAGHTIDETNTSGYVFEPAYSKDTVYQAYYESWVARYGESPESLADMIYYIMRDNKRLGVNTVCDKCKSSYVECTGSSWWLDYQGLFTFIEHNRIGFEYQDLNGNGIPDCEEEDYQGPASADIDAAPGDLRPYAQAIAQEMMSDRAQHVVQYAAGTHVCYVDGNPAKGEHKYYCTDLYVNSELVPKAYMACCGGGSTATAVYAGLTGSESMSNAGTVGCPSDYTQLYLGPLSELDITYAELPVGTIICCGPHDPAEVATFKPGQGKCHSHCTILVAKDDNWAYYAGFGGDSYIEAIARDGYEGKKDVNSVVCHLNRQYIYIYTPNKQAPGGGGPGSSIADVAGYPNPTDIETGRTDMSLLEESGVDVGSRRFDGSWYTFIDGWNTDTTPEQITVGGYTFAAFTSPPYDASLFTSRYFFDIGYYRADMKNWLSSFYDYYGYDIGEQQLRTLTNFTTATDDLQCQQGDNKLAYNLAKTYIYPDLANTYHGNDNDTTRFGWYTGISDVGGPFILCGQPYLNLTGPGNAPICDSWWEKYHDVSGLYNAKNGQFSGSGDPASSYNTAPIAVVKESSTGKIYYIPCLYNDGKGHYFPFSAGQSDRQPKSRAVMDICDPSSTIIWSWKNTGHAWSIGRNVNRDNPSEVNGGAGNAAYGLLVTHQDDMAVGTVGEYFEHLGQYDYAATRITVLAYTSCFEMTTSAQAIANGKNGYTLEGFILCSDAALVDEDVALSYNYNINNSSSSDLSGSGNNFGINSRSILFRPENGAATVLLQNPPTSWDSFSGPNAESSGKGVVTAKSPSNKGTWEVRYYYATTDELLTTEDSSKGTVHKIYVYKPYGYSENEVYPVVYIQMGINGKVSNVTQGIKNALDAAIENKEMSPTVWVVMEGRDQGGRANERTLAKDSNGDGKINLFNLMEQVRLNYAVSTDKANQYFMGISDGSIEMDELSDTVYSQFALVGHVLGYDRHHRVANINAGTLSADYTLIDVFTGGESYNGDANWADCGVSYYTECVNNPGLGLAYCWDLQGKASHNTVDALECIIDILCWYS